MEDSLSKEVSCSNVSKIGDLCMVDVTDLSGLEESYKWENREISQGLDVGRFGTTLTDILDDFKPKNLFIMEEGQRMIAHSYPKQDAIFEETKHEQNSYNELGKVQKSHEGETINLVVSDSKTSIADSSGNDLNTSTDSSAHDQNRPNKTEDSPEEAEKCTGLNERINDSDIDNVSPSFLSNSSNSLHSQTKEGFVTIILNEKSHSVPIENVDTLSELNSTDSNEKVIIQNHSTCAEHLCDINDNLKLTSGEVLSVKCYDVDQSTLPANSENYLNYKSMSEETGDENSKVSEVAGLKLNSFDIGSKETVQSLEQVDEGIQSITYEDFRDGSLESLGEEDSSLEIIESKHEQKRHTIAIQENEYTDTELEVSESDADGRIEFGNDSDINSGKTSKAQSISQEKSFLNELKSEGSLESFMSYSDKGNSISDDCMADLTNLSSISSFRSDEPTINEGHQRVDGSPNDSGAVFHNSSLQDSMLSNVIDFQTVLQIKKLLLALSSELEKEKLHYEHHVKLLTAQITTLEAKLDKHDKSTVDCVCSFNNKMNREMAKNDNTLVNIANNVISYEERLKNTSNEVEKCKQELRSALNKSLNTINNTKEDYVRVSAKLAENDKTPNFVNDLDRIIFLADELMKSDSFKEINMLEKINQTNCNHNGENIKRLDVLKRFSKNYFDLLKSNNELTVLNRKLEESSERDKKLLDEKNETIKAFSDKYDTLNGEYKQVQNVLKEKVNEHNQHLKIHSDLERSFKLTKEELDQLKYHNCLNELELNKLRDIEIINNKLKDDNELLKAEIESLHHNYINKYDIMKKISLLEEENARLKDENSELSEQFKRETDKYDELNERCKKWQLLYDSLNDKLKKSETTFNKISSNNEMLKKEVVQKELFEDHFISGFRQLFALDEQLVDFNPDNFSKDLINEGFQRLRQRLIKLQELGKSAHYEKNRANNMEVECSILNSIIERKEFEINSLSEKLKQEVNSHKTTIKSLMNCNQLLTNENSGLKSQIKNLENLPKALNNISESECNELKEYIKQLKIDLVDSNAKISSLELHIESCCSYNRKRVQDYKQEVFYYNHQLLECI
ncbi:girdin-like isoform X2 [Cimex lectularius]|uniref:Uncharacterized protein n=1 Tax=Cimex lectularius TaxID=79782 RepID=A0A8I6TF24_CIMLE|nr:girdin-like isoform X2 [Cimex lectularius]